MKLSEQFSAAMARFDDAKTVAETQNALAALLRTARECESQGVITDDEFQGVLALVQEFLDEER